MSYKTEIRPVEPGDYAALAEMANAAFPGTTFTAEELQNDDQALAPLRSARFVAEAGERLVGTVAYTQYLVRFHPQKFWLDLFVHPDLQGEGIGSALYERGLAELAPFDPVLVRTATREDLGHSLRFLSHRGYTEAKRTWELHLDLVAFDFTPYQGVEAKAELHGIEIRQMTELQQPGWEEKYLALYNAIQADVPDFEPATPLTMAQFREGRLEKSSFLAAGHFIALDGAEWIGLNTLWRGNEPHELSVGLTGVLPAYRGKGIAMALKVRGLAWAREQGITRVTTHNASTNLPMLAINEQMGFVRQPAWIHLVREF